MEQVVNIRLKIPKKINQKLDLRLIKIRGLNIKTTKEKLCIDLIKAGLSNDDKK